MLKITKKDRALLDKAGSELTPEAKAELERLWSLRDQYNVLNEVTLPLLCQYVAVEEEVKELTLSFDGSEEEGAYDLVIERLTKLQKVMLAYAKVLQIDKPVVVKSKNKFADLLL